MYGELEGVQAAKVYASSGASANEIAVFRAADKAGAEKIYQAGQPAVLEGQEACL